MLANKLREMLYSHQLEFIMEAHNGLSAKIVKNTGFKGIWASGLSLSASLGMRDSNEASWTQLLDILTQMRDASNLPILFDGDTGFGNFNNFRLLCKKLVERDIAGVCIEDKLFPKTNSFINGEKQKLEDIEKFSLKIKAGKSVVGDNLVIVARLESFITGRGLQDALNRAEAYAHAGADAILVHSKINNFSEIQNFMNHWRASEFNRVPIIIVPTKYYETPTQAFRAAGISLVIWANHNMRASISAMENVSAEIFKNQSLATVEKSIATVNHVFELQDQSELTSAEGIYDGSISYKAIILAATSGSNSLGDLIGNKAKCALDFKGSTLIDYIAEKIKPYCEEMAAVFGYQSQNTALATEHFRDNYCVNTDWENTTELDSLRIGFEHYLNNQVDDYLRDLIICYGDTLISSDLIQKVISADNCDAAIIVSTKPDELVSANNILVPDLMLDPNFSQDNEVLMNDDEPSSKFQARFSGFICIKSSLLCKQILNSLQNPKSKNKTLVDLIQEMVFMNYRFKVFFSNEDIFDIDTKDDYLKHA